MTIRSSVKRSNKTIVEVADPPQWPHPRHQHEHDAQQGQHAGIVGDVAAVHVPHVAEIVHVEDLSRVADAHGRNQARAVVETE
jgi:hypothetical protein